MAELQQDKAKQAEWLMKAPITSNEFREAIGYEESTEPEADEILIPSGLVKLSDMQGDGGEELMQSLYNANGSTNRSNGVPKVPKGKKGAKL